MPDNSAADSLTRLGDIVLDRLEEHRPTEPLLPDSEGEALGLPSSFGASWAERLPASSDASYGANYSDSDFWPFKCPTCNHGFMEKIGEVRSRLVSRCPRCASDIAHEREQFFLELSEARNGRRNPWWEMLCDSPSD